MNVVYAACLVLDAVISHPVTDYQVLKNNRYIPQEHAMFFSSCRPPGGSWTEYLLAADGQRRTGCSRGSPRHRRMKSRGRGRQRRRRLTFRPRSACQGQRCWRWRIWFRSRLLQWATPSELSMLSFLRLCSINSSSSSLNDRVLARTEAAARKNKHRSN